VQRIILIGFMGAGKTYIGKRMALYLKMDFVDCDQLIEKAERMTVNKIFEEQGERYFRKVETQILKRVLKKRSVVIATGGGVVIKKENRLLMKQSGVVVWIQAGLQQILDRLKHDRKRPLLRPASRIQEIKRLMKHREDHYRKTAHFRCRNTGGDVRRLVWGLSKRITRSLKT